MSAINFEDIRLRCEDAADISRAILEKIGIPAEDANVIVDNLLFADMRGVSTHGLSRMQSYCQRAESGYCNIKPTIKVVKETTSTALIDGDHGYGAVVGSYAMKLAMKKAKANGIAMCVVRNSSHYGAAAYYTTMAVAENMIGFSCTNAVPNMAPYGSFTPLLGTNPFSVAAPAEEHDDVVLDIASSAVARGNILNAAREGASIPLGWALDAEGKPTTDANAALSGCVVPFGGHKGSGIALFIDILSGVLGGDVFGKHLRNDKKSAESGLAGPGVSHVFIAIDIEAFQDVSSFKSHMDQEIDEIKGGQKAAGVKEILVPGELEARRTRDYKETGIWLGKAAFENLCNLSAKYETGFDPHKFVISAEKE